eukprot:scaffold7234_cov53-Phaeocystis_antarctica.AAC.2
MLAARVSFGNRARVVGLARSPTMRTPSPTTKLLAGMLASEAGGRRVIYQKYTLNKKKNVRGGASATASASAPKFGQWPGNRRKRASGRPYRPCFSHSRSGAHAARLAHLCTGCGKQADLAGGNRASTVGSRSGRSTFRLRPHMAIPGAPKKG